MRRPASHLIGIATLLGCLAASGAVAADSSATMDHPLSGRVSIFGGSRAGVSLQGAWAPAGTMVNPKGVASTLRIAGGPNDGDTGVIELLASKWHVQGRGNGFRYVDPKGSAGGIRLIVIRMAKKGGSIKVQGGKRNWHYQLSQAQQKVTVSLTIGQAHWCAEFAESFSKNTTKLVRARSKKAPASCPCDGFASTWEAIQKVVFDRHGCTQAICHGSSPGQGNLDLRPDVAYTNLVGAPSTASLLKRVERGSRQDSFLYKKLAAKTLGDPLRGDEGTPMPQTGAALSTDELEAVRLWIQAGAPETGVVAGTAAKLSTCLPPAGPTKIEPAAPPAAGTGVQFHAPPWTIKPQSEDEVCFATYHDLDAQIPDEFKGPCDEDYWGPGKTCFFYNKTELTQDPNSHHSIIHVYKGQFPAKDPGFLFQCRGGALDGQPCDPTVTGVAPPNGADCGADSVCTGKSKSSLACLTFGPPDYNGGGGAGLAAGQGSNNAPSFGGSQQPFARTVDPPGVSSALPTKLIVVWNSHAFNLTDVSTTNEQWLNLYFAAPQDRLYPARGIFDSTDIFVQDVPPFEEREYCRTTTMRRGSRVYELSTHAHKRSRLFRVWGPGIAAPCRSTKDDPGACQAETSTPVVVTTQYNDPAVVRFDPPLVLDDPDPAKRRFKFCSVYDNGFTDAATVKRNSESPIPPSFGTLAPGGPCFVPPGLFSRDLGVACLAGPKKGMVCQGDDRACDSAAGKNDGKCDACPLEGGVTTEDEMFILLGRYFCAPDTECEGTCSAPAAKLGQLCHGDSRECDSVPGKKDGRCQSSYSN